MTTNSPFSEEESKNEYQKVHANILLTASWLNLQATKSLKSFHISHQQFQILGILHHFRPTPLTVKTLTNRMMDQASNASRLVEKLKTKGLVERKACAEDRRRVEVYITDAGLELLEKAMLVFEKNRADNFNKLQSTDIEYLNRLLTQLRG